MQQPSIRKNYLYRLTYEILIIIIPFITTPYVSRVLGADGIGIYSYTSSIMSYFTMFAALGTLSYGAREIARHRDDRQVSSKLFWEIEFLTIFTSLISLGIWIFVIIISNEYKYFFIALVPILLATMVDISWYFTGYEQTKYIVLRNIFCKLAGVVLLFILVRKKEDILTYVIINSVVQLVGNLSMWTYLPRMLVKVDFKKLTIKKHFQETLVYFIPTISTSVYTVLDKTLIGLITKDTYQNGYYEQANKIISILKTLVFVAVNSVMGARISYLFSEEKYEEIHMRINRSMSYIFLLGFGFSFGLVGVADKFVPLFLGKGYKPVIKLLYLKAPLILIIGVSNCLGGQYYTPSGKRKQSAKYIIMGSVSNLIFNLVLIPRWQSIGAAVATVIAELMITCLYVHFSDEYMTAKGLWKLAWKKFLAGIIMFSAIWGIGKVVLISDLAVLISQISIGVIVYGLALYFLQDQMFSEFLDIGFSVIRRKGGFMNDRSGN